MNRIELEVELRDGTVHTVSADMHDLRMWETHAMRNRIPYDDTAPKITYMTFLAYSALRRAGIVNGSFDGFEAVGIEALGSEAEDPTRPAPSAGS